MIRTEDSTVRKHTTISRIALPFLFLIGMWFGMSSALAQLPTATILGVVRDPSGAVVPEVSLTARNVETGQTRAARSAADGSYRFQALPVGSYEVRVEHAGFQSEVRSGLTLAVAQEAVINFTLQVGAVEQTVAVTAEAPLVNTTSGSLGGLVDSQKIAELPLNGRNYIDLTLLQMGVNEQKTVSRAGGARIGTYFSSSGATPRSNNYMLDGANMTNIWGASSSSATGATLGVDGIREFRVITSAFSAEYGLTMGSQMVIVSKGGTNDFHGTVFEYHRNAALDARNSFDYKSIASQRRLPNFVRNNFGGSIGGPIKRDKTFFHAVIEGVRERLGITTINTVIPPSARVDGGLVPAIAPVVKPFIALYPLPNLPNNQFTYPFTQPANDNYGQVRVDQNFSSEDTLFVRYTVYDSQRLTPGGFPQFRFAGTARNTFVTLSENHIFSPTLLNTARYSLSRTSFFWNFDNDPGMDSPGLALVPGLPTGGVSISGITGIGSSGSRRHKQNLSSISDDLFYTRGRHSLKFGVLFNHYLQVIRNSASWLGSASFPTLERFLLAQPQTIAALTPGSSIERTYAFNALGLYMQDDWQARSNLTLNLGLRYEFSTVPIEQHGEYSVIKDLRNDANFTISPEIYKNPSLRTFSPRFGFAWDVKGDGKTAVRGGFGLLFDLIGPQTGTFVLQSQVATPPFSQRLQAANPPVFTVPLTFPATTASLAPRPTDWNIHQPHILSYNLTVERQLPFNMGIKLAYAGSRGINLPTAKEGNPTVPQGVPVNGVCVARPAGQAWDINQPYCWMGGDPRTNPNFGTMDLFTSAASSWYNGLQFGLQKRLSNGLQFQSSYTWSRTIDENAGSDVGERGASNPGNGAEPTRREYERGLAVFDLTQVWKFNVIYYIPNLISSGGVAAKLLNGWWTSGILSFQSGYPFTPALGSNRSRSLTAGGGGGRDRPDLVVGRNASNITKGTSTGCLGFPAGTPVGTVQRYYDPCAFTIPAAGFLGTAGRNTLRGQGFANVDFSLVKDTAFGFLGESGKLQFRAEIFNILNRANFALPSRNVFAGTADVQAPLGDAGLITETLGTSRQIQLAVKILF